MENMVEWEGYVERITFRNEENGYTVLHLSDAESGDEICCVGNFSFISEGLYLHINGKEVVHPNYGVQIQVESYEEQQPTDKVAIERYLASGAIKGVKSALAAKIVERFGDETFEVIENDPERLAEIKGISKKKAIQISEQFHEKQEMRQAMLFLQDYGISMNMAVKIYKHYGDGMYEVLEKNPYKLAEDVQGIGFKIADGIAIRAGFGQDSQYRIQAGILYQLQQSSGSQGHCYLPEKELVEKVSELLLVEREAVEAQLEQMTLNKEIKIEETVDGRHMYSSSLYYMELNCARMLLDLNLSYEVDESALDRRIRQVEKEGKIELDELQKNAVYQAVKNGVTIITGGPGTGKTTTINTILQILEQEGLDILLAAPTGRAAKRISETSGWEARTIHRLLEVSGGTDLDNGDKAGLHFERNEKQPLEADAIIVDEFSMVDIYLLNALLRAIVPGTRLIMVGDVNQLPSVGPGNVLKDMIQADFCSVVRLNRIFRQAAESRIVVNAHRINAGEAISLKDSSPDFLHLERQESRDTINVVVQLVMQKLPPHVEASPYDIQVLTPMRRGELGVENLNKVLQQYMNPQEAGKQEREFHNVLFREQDKVMQIRNDYQIKWEKKTRLGDVFEEGMGIFNGDTGVIREIAAVEEKVIVEFEEGRLVEYDFGQMDELELAYAITVHKSQGSEYPAVVLPLLGGSPMLMNRNLLYTAVTRAKKCVVTVGKSSTIQNMIQNMHERTRYSSLCQRIKEMEAEDSERYY